MTGEPLKNRISKRFKCDSRGAFKQHNKETIHVRFKNARVAEVPTCGCLRCLEFECVLIAQVAIKKYKLRKNTRNKKMPS